MSRRSKFLMWINYRIRVTIQDSRMFVGTLLAFDKHMNFVLADTEEYRKIKSKKEEPDKEIKRALGLVLIRGANIVSLTPEAPPTQKAKRFFDPALIDQGKARAIGRAVQLAPSTAPQGLSGPALGVGAPSIQSMLPSNEPLTGEIPRPMGPPPTSISNQPPIEEIKDKDNFEVPNDKPVIKDEPQKVEEMQIDNSSVPVTEIKPEPAKEEMA